MMNPFKTKKGLGRGLSSLIGDVDSKPLKNIIGVKDATGDLNRVNQTLKKD